MFWTVNHEGVLFMKNFLGSKRLILKGLYNYLLRIHPRTLCLGSHRKSAAAQKLDRIQLAGTRTIPTWIHVWTRLDDGSFSTSLAFGADFQ